MAKRDEVVQLSPFDESQALNAVQPTAANLSTLSQAARVRVLLSVASLYGITFDFVGYVENKS